MSPKPAVWAAVVAEHDRALRVARARCASPQDAEDCVQEAMLRVAGMDAVDLDRVGPLLTTVVANLAADGHRSRIRRARAYGRLHNRRLPQSSVDERVCDDSEARWLWARRLELGVQDRRVLELRAQGRSGAQVAEALGISPKAAEASFTRARSRLKGVWRAAGVGVGVLWCRVSRQPAASGGIAVAAAVSVVAALTLTSGPPTEAAPSPASVRPGQDARDSPPAPVVPPPPSAPTAGPAPAGVSPQLMRQPPAAADPVPSPGAPSVPAAPDVPPTPPPTPPPTAPPTPPPTAPPTPPPGPAPETLPEMVQRCVQEGVTVSPPGVRCLSR